MHVDTEVTYNRTRACHPTEKEHYAYCNVRMTKATATMIYSTA